MSVSRRITSVVWIFILFLTLLFDSGTSQEVEADDTNVTAAPSSVSSNATSEPESVEEDDKAIHYILPSFAITLRVTKSDNALILFQDRLEQTIQLHLEAFYKQKLDEDSSTDSRVEEVGLKSQLVWKELSVYRSESTSDLEPEVKDIFKHYEVLGKFDCQIALDDSPSYVTQSLMDLFFIEAFQGDNYWDLVHSFLVSPVLEDINDVTITILEDGFVPYDGQPSIASLDDDWYGREADSTSHMTPFMIVGAAFATLFCIALLVMWMYLCFTVNGASLLFMGMGRRRRDSIFKDGSVTDDACTTDSTDLSNEDESSWMDAWAEAVTSVELRDPVKTKRKRGRPTRQSFVRPAREHHSSLGCIDESDNESCSSAKTEASKKSIHRSTTVPRTGSFQQETASYPSNYFSTIAELGPTLDDNQLDLLDHHGDTVDTISDDQDDLFSDSRSVSSDVTIWLADTPSVTSLDIKDRLSI